MKSKVPGTVEHYCKCFFSAFRSTFHRNTYCSYYAEKSGISNI